MGPRVGAIARKLGQPLMPWQQQVADVGLELADGLPAYREIIVTVPRQNGKTTLVLAWELDRALTWGGRQQIIYSAQTGADAREKFLKDQVPLIEQSPFMAAVDKVERANGREALLFRGGSRIVIIASSESAGHGKTIGLGVVDEAFDDVDDRREQAMLPAMVTVADAQLVVCSTMGTDASIYLNRKVDTGRAIAVRDADDADVAYFEWSAPHDADIDDPAVWQSCMPAYGRTIGPRAVKHARATMTEGEFRRAFLNQRTSSEERVIPAAVWDRVCSDDVQPDGQVMFAVDCSPERASASIAVADRQGNVELVEHGRGTGWLVAHATALARKWSAPIALDPAGPAGPFQEEFARQQIQTIPVSGRDFAKACGFFYDSVVDQNIRIRQHAQLDAAVAAVIKRVSVDTWVWSRKEIATPIDPLVAATVAFWAAQNSQPPRVEMIVV